MLSQILVSSDVNIYDLVQFDASQELWVNANKAGGLLGIVCGLPEDESVERVAFVRFSGQVQARATREINAQGGALAVENGGVYVASDPESSSGRYILPSRQAVPVGALCPITL